MMELTQQTGEASVLARLDGITSSLVFVEFVSGPQRLLYHIPLHKHLSLYNGASGLAVLAHLPQDQRARFSGAQNSLHAIRSSGVAYTCGDRIPGAAGISSPVINDTGEIVGSVTLTIPVSRIPPPGEQRRFGVLVRECAAQIRQSI